MEKNFLRYTQKSPGQIITVVSAVIETEEIKPILEKLTETVKNIEGFEFTIKIQEFCESSEFHSRKNLKIKHTEKNTNKKVNAVCFIFDLISEIGNISIVNAEILFDEEYDGAYI